MLDSPITLITWAKYQQSLERIIAKKDVPLLLKLAKESGADYIITQNGFPRVTGWVPVNRDRLWMVYKKPQVEP